METILKELKGSNRSGGSTLNFTRIRIKGFFYYLLRGFQLQRCRRCIKKRLCYYYDWKYKLGHKCKRKQNFLLDGDESEGKAISEAENDIKEDILWFQSIQYFLQLLIRPWESWATLRKRSWPYWLTQEAPITSLCKEYLDISIPNLGSIKVHANYLRVL